MRALREGVVPTWLLGKAQPADVRKRGLRRRGATYRPRPMLLDAFRIARALIEGEPISAPILRDKFGIPYSTAKRLMYELSHAYEGRLEERMQPRVGRAGTATRVIRWRRKA